jgi:hypothetical protein
MVRRSAFVGGSRALRSVTMVACLAAIVVALADCGGDGDGVQAGDAGTTVAGPATTDTSTPPYAPEIDPAEFTTAIDNPWLPLRPGTVWVYEGRGEAEGERIVVEVTSETRVVMGVECVVVRDTVSEDGEVVEDTFDWFAQDAEGNVWYFGEDTKDYEDGEVVSTEGAWEAGVDGAQPGIVMPGIPKVGDAYRQEYLAGEAEDMGEILSLDERAVVPFGTFDPVLQTKDFTPLEPGVVEHKFYAEGIGLVLEVKVEGGEERVELVEHNGKEQAT